MILVNLIMSLRPDNRTMVSEAGSQSAMSEINHHNPSSSRTDGFSTEDVFGAMMKDLHELLEEVAACETEYDHVSKQAKSNSKEFRYQDSSFNQREAEYRDILNAKGSLLENITATIENMNSSPDIPKAKIHCYQKYVALLQQRFKNIQQEMRQLVQDVKKAEQECVRIDQQVETFKKLIEDNESSNEGDEVMRLFTEAKTDLNTLLTHLYSQEEKAEFSNTMAQLTDAFMNNDDEEDQYVELSPEILQNSGILCLVKRFVIVEDPSNPLRYRLNMAE